MGMNTSALAGLPARLRAGVWAARGRRRLAAGALGEAEACCRKALGLCENHTEAYALLTRVLMPGDDYLAVLARLHKRFQPLSYVEIGVRTGVSLALTQEGTSAIGIDPRFSIGIDIRSRAKVYPTTSDAFFSRYDLLEELHAPRLALAFIDGLHLFEQALRDFTNLERYADSETVILIHDCVPMSRVAAARERRSAFWCGDVWKVVRCLRKHRPDLTIRIIPARPSGLAMITGANPHSTVLREQSDRIVAEFRDADLGYDFLDFEILKNTPGLLPNDPEHIDFGVR